LKGFDRALSAPVPTLFVADNTASSMIVVENGKENSGPDVAPLSQTQSN
jgi:hypothetical protein